MGEPSDLFWTPIETIIGCHCLFHRHRMMTDPTRTGWMCVCVCVCLCLLSSDAWVVFQICCA